LTLSHFLASLDYLLQFIAGAFEGDLAGINPGGQSFFPQSRQQKNPCSRTYGPSDDREGHTFSEGTHFWCDRILRGIYIKQENHHNSEL